VSKLPWHVLNGATLLIALRRVSEGVAPEAAYLDLCEEVESREDYRSSEDPDIGSLQDPLEDVPLDALDEAGQLRLRNNDLEAVIEIQRNGLEFLMRELMERNGESTIDVAQRVDFLLSQPLG